MNFPFFLETRKGANIAYCWDAALELAKRYHERITFVFNDKEFIVTENSTNHDLERQFNEEVTL